MILKKRAAAQTLGPCGFTLMELVVVLVIVSILVALAVPAFTLIKERALDKEALAGIKVLRSAERRYYARYGTYTTGNINDIGTINSLLSTTLNESNWNYRVRYVAPHGVSVSARRTVGGTRSWAWDSEMLTNESPQCTGGGCP